jgi:hypothetical protein
MSVLDRATRSDLLTALDAIVVLDTLNGRTLLLQNLPAALANTLARDEAKAVDLANMVYAADAWSADALRTMIETARDLVPGSTSAAQLQAVLNSLTSSPAPGSPPIPADPQQLTVSQPALIARANQPNRITARICVFAFVIAFCAALFIHYVSNALIGRTTTGWVLLNQATLEDWLIALTLVLLPAMVVAWAISRYSPTWLLAQIAGASFGLALFRLIQANLVDMTLFGTDPGFIAMLVSCVMIACGILAGLALVEQRQALAHPKER